MKKITIGRLSKAANVKVTTIRYYESIELMGKAERSESGQRLYDDSSIQRLTFIRHARDLGFAVDDIRELIELQSQSESNCKAVDEIARSHLSSVRQRIQQLASLETELERMVSNCKGNDIGTCQIMKSLNDHSACLSEAHDRIKPM